MAIVIFSWILYPLAILGRILATRLYQESLQPQAMAAPICW
jgi:hypothetical protein